MKKIISLALVLVMALSLTACGKKPEELATEAVCGMIDALKSGEYEKAATFSNVDASAALGQDEETKQMTNLMFANIEYRIISAQAVDANTVKVQVEISNKNMEIIFSNYLAKVFEIALEYGETLTAEEATAKSQAILKECTADESVGMRTETVEVIVLKVDNKWQVQSDEKYTNALLGGILDMAAKYNQMAE